MDLQQLDTNRRRFITGVFALGLGSTLMPGAVTEELALRQARQADAELAAGT